MRRPSVLVVDDEAFSRAVVSRKLSILADVVDAEDGHDALEQFHTTPFDLAIIDLEMPNCDGYDLIRCIRGHPKFKHIPVIVVTGNDSRKALEGALAAGATSFLLKPLNWGAFGEHIRHVLELAYRSNHLAMHDSLTGLPNRALLNERLQQALANNAPDAQLAVHLLDLDQFKQTNDTLGHFAGDQLLRNVADRLRPLLRESDTIARMGGDEFAIVQSPVTKASDAEALAKRVVEVLSTPFDIDGNRVIIGTSIGIALGPRYGSNAETLVRNADLALYQAKGDGRGAYRFFKPDMDSQQQARRVMEYDLRNALENDEFALHYQPLVSLKNNSIIGFEALLRWHHPEKGMIPPDTFIPLAEEMGLIVPLGGWIIRRACAAAAQWPDDLKVAVNVSPIQFSESKFLELVKGAISQSGLAPGRLELEITETASLIDNSEMLATLHELRALGVRIVTDDFGIGYSSLSLLQEFPFDKIKIDRSFVKDVVSSATSISIVRAVASLAKGLGIPSTAEGIEDDAQLQRVQLEGCTEVQGYLLSRPLPAHEILEFLHSRRSTWTMKKDVAAEAV